MNDPNVYKVPPQMVNITQANPQHLNPQYGEYLARDEQRIRQGNFPGGNFGSKGAPLAPSKKGSARTGGGAFPGLGSATYHEAANK